MARRRTADRAAKAVAVVDAVADVAAVAATATAVASQATSGGEGSEGAEFAGAREASDEEREFHAQMTNGNRGEGREQPEPSRASEHSDRSANLRASRSVSRQREPQRESRNEGSQAPLDLPPPPPTKPFVVWSSSPTDASPGHAPRRISSPTRASERRPARASVRAFFHGLPSARCASNPRAADSHRSSTCSKSSMPP